MPPSTARSDTRGRPPFGFGRARGSNGATRAHKSSGTWTLMDPQHRTASQVLLGALSSVGLEETIGLATLGGTVEGVGLAGGGFALGYGIGVLGQCVLDPSAF